MRNKLAGIYFEDHFIPFETQDQNISSGGGMAAFDNMKKSILASYKGVYVGGLQPSSQTLNNPVFKFWIFERREIALDIRAMIAGRGGYIFPYDDLLTFVSRGAQVNLFFENGEEMKLDEINEQLKTHLLIHENNINMLNLVDHIQPVTSDEMRTFIQEARLNI